MADADLINAVRNIPSYTVLSMQVLSVDLLFYQDTSRNIQSSISSRGCMDVKAAVKPLCFFVAAALCSSFVRNFFFAEKSESYSRSYCTLDGDRPQKNRPNKNKWVENGLLVAISE